MREMRWRTVYGRLLAAILLVCNVGCGSSNTTPPPPPTFKIGGTVSGLSGTGLVLQNNSADNLAITANGPFTFPTAVASGHTYIVTVLTQPSNPSQACVIANGTGTVIANVTNLQVTCSAAGSPGNEWTWMSGSQSVDQPGIYGTLGVASAANTPGARVYAGSGTDAAGDFWLFGGYGAGSTTTQGDLNDLWKYSGGQWTWISGSNQTEQAGVYGTQGTPAPGNVPGARFEAASWIDASGDFWIFGGVGKDSTGTRGDLNDLWRYSDGQWTWMSGSSVAAQAGIPGAFQGAGVYGTLGVPDPANVPGVRFDAMSWSDASGNLWLFGGEGSDANGAFGLLNDLWRYSSGQWTWMSGSNIANQYGIYGTQGTPAPTNVPGARASAATWTDAHGNLWLFGGEGNDVNGISEHLDLLNDLWEYSGGQWTWVSGSQVGDRTGAYGTQGVASPGNYPGGREGSISWIDAQGNLWLFGGNGLDSSTAPGVYGDLNDLWEYRGGLWTWLSGSNHAGMTGVFGTLGTPAPANVPGARDSAVGWSDKSGNLWLFGGGDYLSVPGGGKLNDLWEYTGWGPAGPPNPPAATTYTIGGAVSGLTGSGLVIQNDRTGNLAISGDGAFTFTAPLTSGSAYSVSVLTQPSSPSQYCVVQNGSGIASANVTNIQITCTAFTPGHKVWTWVSGSQAVDQPASYGILGVASVANLPGARLEAASWKDSAGNLWLFGGNVGYVGNMLIGPGGSISLTYFDLNDLWKYSGGEWTWMAGSDQRNHAGVYGTLGTPSPANIPGARHGAVTWTDASGNFWLFGGIGIDSAGVQGDLNDLWEFSGGEWTWVAGSGLANQSGSYGTEGVGAAGNAPGARDGAVGWMDTTGNLWLFGGYGYDSTGTACFNHIQSACLLNDLWKYSGGQWTWMSGSATADQSGTYGTLGSAAPGNSPGSRQYAAGWTDAAGNLWLFGGWISSVSNGSSQALSDLWKFSSGQWTWEGGPNVMNQPGTWGTQGVAASANKPSARGGAVSWTDATGNLWLFGGYGIDATGSQGALNDLWRYSAGTWTWVSGSNIANEAGSYGVEGVANPGNIPPGRSGAIGWTDGGGYLWLFGGELPGSILGDLWKYEP